MSEGPATSADSILITLDELCIYAKVVNKEVAVKPEKKWRARTKRKNRIYPVCQRPVQKKLSPTRRKNLTKNGQRHVCILTLGSETP